LNHLLALCNNVESVCISNSLVTEECFSVISRCCPRLIGLHAYNVQFKLQTLKEDHLLFAMKMVVGQLRELTVGRGTSFHNPDLTEDEDATMKILKYAQKLVSLNLAFFTPQSFAVMQKGLRHLKHCKPLEKLTIYTTLKLSGSDTRHLAALPCLATLLFAGTKLTSSAMRRLPDCLALKELYLHEVVVTEGGITALKSIPNLQRLFLIAMRGLTDTGVAELADCQHLEGLEIVQSETITDKGIIPLAKSNSLRVLSLDRTPNVSGFIRRSFLLTRIVVIVQ